MLVWLFLLSISCRTHIVITIRRQPSFKCIASVGFCFSWFDFFLLLLYTFAKQLFRCLKFLQHENT